MISEIHCVDRAEQAAASLSPTAVVAFVSVFVL